MTTLVSSYPSLYSLGHRFAENLLTGPITVEEKVDGSQFSFGLIEGQLCCRSKGQQLILDAPEKMFSLAVQSVRQLEPLLHPGWTYRAEYLRSPTHNTATYGRIPTLHLILFDVMMGEEAYLTYEEKAAEAQRLGLEVVPQLVPPGVALTHDLIVQLLQRESCLGGCLIEGIVVKNYAQCGPDKKVLMGKYVSPAFKETHALQWKHENPGSGDVIATIIASLNTHARWEKSIQHLRDEGSLTNSPNDIGPLLKEIQTDVAKEETETIKEALFHWAWPQIKRGVIRGFPEWYKERVRV